MPTQEIVPSERHAAFLDRLVASGRYRDASEVVRDTLDLREHDGVEAEKLVKRLNGSHDRAVETKAEVAPETGEEVVARVLGRVREGWDERRQSRASMKLWAFHHVALVVPDVDASGRWYGAPC